MDVEKFIIIFGEEGAKKVLAQIEELDKRLAAFAKKYVNDQVQAEVNLEKFRKRQLNNLDKFKEQVFKKDSRRGRRLFDQESKQISQLKKLRKTSKTESTGSSSSDTSDSDNNKRSGGRGSEWGTIKLAAAIYALGRLAVGATRWLGTREKNARIYSGLYGQTGMSSPRAEAYDLAVRQMGGERGEGLKTLTNINSALGAMKYGDTSLIDVLGKFGIGGIHTGSNAEDVLRAVADKSSGMDAKSQQALFDALGLSDANQLLIREANKRGNASEIFKDADSIVEWTQKLQEGLNDQVKTEDNTYKAIVKGTENLTEIQKSINAVEQWLTSKFPTATTLGSGVLSNPVGQGVAGYTGASILKNVLFGRGGQAAGGMAAGRAIGSKVPHVLAAWAGWEAGRAISDATGWSETRDEIWGNIFYSLSKDGRRTKQKLFEQEQQKYTNALMDAREPVPLYLRKYMDSHNVSDSYNTTNIYNGSGQSPAFIYPKAESESAPVTDTFQNQGGRNNGMSVLTGGF